MKTTEIFVREYNHYDCDCLVGVDLRESSNLKYLYELHDDFAALPPFVCIPSTVAVISSDISQAALPEGMSMDLTKVMLCIPTIIFVLLLKGVTRIKDKLGF